MLLFVSEVLMMLATACPHAADDAAATAAFERERARIGDVVQLVVSVHGEGAVDAEILPLPSIEGLDIDAPEGPSIVAGDAPGTVVARYTVAVRPLRAGEFLLAGIRVLVKSDVEVEVEPARLVVEDAAESAFAFEVAAERASVFIQETFSVRIAVRRNAADPPPSRRELRLPWLKHVFVPPADRALGPDDEAFDVEGQSERVRLARRIDGASVILEGTLEVQASTPGEIDFSSSRLRLDPRVTAEHGASQGGSLFLLEIPPPPASVTVMPLPAPAPPAFVDAVGRFEVEARTDRSIADLGELIVLVIEARAQEGDRTNLRTALFTRLDAIDGFRVFSRRDERSEAGIAIRFEIAAVSREARAVPPLRFAWFDPIAGEYREAETKPIPLEIRVPDAPGAPGARGGSDAASTREDRRWFDPWHVAGLALLAWVVLLMGRAVRRRASSASAVTQAPDPIEAIHERRTRLDAASDPCTLEVARDLAHWLAFHLDCDPGACFGASAAALLNPRGVPAPLIAEVAAYFDAVEERAFSANPTAPREFTAARLRALLEAIEELSGSGTLNAQR